MNKSMKPSRPAGKPQVAPLTPEQKQEAMLRFFTQKRESFTTGILFNLCQSVEHIPTDAECHAIDLHSRQHPYPKQNGQTFEN